jgi:hypothetical protein
MNNFEAYYRAKSLFSKLSSPKRYISYQYLLEGKRRFKNKKIGIDCCVKMHVELFLGA